MRRGEVWWARLPDPWGRRPVLLLARDEAYEILTWVMVAPLTTTLRDIPTAVQLDPERDGVNQPCIVILDSIQAIRKEWLEARMAKLPSATMQAVERAARFALALREQ